MCTVNMDGASLPDRWAISSEAAHSWQIWEICCRLNSPRLHTSPIMSGFPAPVWYPRPVWNMSRTFYSTYTENTCISLIKRGGGNRKYCGPLALLLWKLKRLIIDRNTVKGVWWSVRCAETEAHVCESHAALLVAVPQPRFEPSRRPQLCFHTADLLMCRIAQLRIHFSPVCLQEHESATGPGWELRAGPDLHHREDHFRLLPQQRGRAELCSQPAGGRLHAALQTWPKLPGMFFSLSPS